MDFEGYSDASLLALMAMQADEPDFAKEALGALFERHAQFLTPVVARIFGSMLGGATAAEDMVVEVFWRAYVHCGRVGVKGEAEKLETRFHGDDLERSRKSARAWLARVAENMFKDLLRQSERTEELQLDEQALSSLQAPEGTPPLSPEHVQLVNKALEVLTEAERDALVACLPWYDPTTGSFDMGKDAPMVAQSLGKTVGSLKKARRRAVDRLRALALSVPTLTLTESSHE